LLPFQDALEEMEVGLKLSSRNVAKRWQPSAVALTPAEEKKADRDRLLTVFVNACGAPHAHVKRHPVVLALKHAGIAHFHLDFIHMTAADINALQHVKSGTLVPLELNFKMILQALLAFHHRESNKRRGRHMSD